MTTTTRVGPLLPLICQFMSTPWSVPEPEDDPKRTLTHVCKEWRRAIISDAALWAHIRLAPVKYQQPENLLRLFEQDVERSRGMPLTIEMYNDIPRALRAKVEKVEDLMFGGGEFSIIKHILLPEAVRTRLTSLTCTLAKDNIPEFLGLPSSAFPVLRHVNIALIHTLSTPASPFTADLTKCLQFTTFSSHPTLVDATFHIHNRMHPLDLRLPWAQLTKLDLSSAPMPSWTFLVIMKRSAKSLEEAAFQIMFIARANQRLLPKSSQATMPALKKMKLILIDAIWDPAFFGMLKLPVLDRLNIERFDRHVGWELWLFAPLLAYTEGILRRLELKRFELKLEAGDPIPRKRRTSFVELEAVLMMVPRLEVLKLASDVEVHYPTLVKMGRGDLVPNLRVLEMFSTAGKQVLWMVKERFLEPGSSVRGSRVVGLTQLDLWIPVEEKEILSEMVKASGLDKVIDIRGLRVADR
ncbi:hypothetical protein NLJ89_g9904 [Agrocybe chaxingu]|uniref:F-box domain-containing protein n=1 Tax=Agrocybe chaxingu TaxID=84603 RepID=A0A9W8JSC1_9AGAR|nr:hypothetical protein NLJ89_g9904 [Agrocybe chaxingu]